MPKAEACKKPADKGKARVSTTDPESRVMKMPDEGFRPAVNVQFASDTGSQVVTGVDVTNSGSDQGQMPPMLEQHQERYGQVPAATLVDGGFANKEDIERAASAEFGTVVYAPVPEPKKNKDRHGSKGVGKSAEKTTSPLGRFSEADWVSRRRDGNVSGTTQLALSSA
jgi:hypothetical protein